MPLVQEAENLIEPAALRIEFRIAPQVPLPDQPRRVARLAQPVRQRGFGQRQPNRGVGIGGPERIELEAEACLVAAGDQRGARRRAERRRDIPVRETHATARDGYVLPGGRGVAYSRYDLVAPREIRFTTTYSF